MKNKLNSEDLPFLNEEVNILEGNIHIATILKVALFRRRYS